MSQRRIIDTWQGGSSPYHQYIYRLSIDPFGIYSLDVRPLQSADNESSYTPVGRGSLHRVAREVADLLRSEKEELDTYNGKRGVLRRFAM